MTMSRGKFLLTTMMLTHLGASTGFAQSDPPLFAGDCIYINEPIYMCDDQHPWITLELPEDLQGIGFHFDNGIDAEISVMVSPWIGIQVRAQRYTSPVDDDFISEELAKIDGYPAITYISHGQRNGKNVIVAQTTLLLYEINIQAETTRIGDSYTPEHATRHAGVLAGIKHEWSFN